MPRPTQYRRSETTNAVVSQVDLKTLFPDLEEVLAVSAPKPKEAENAEKKESAKPKQVKRDVNSSRA